MVMKLVSVCVSVSTEVASVPTVAVSAVIWALAVRSLPCMEVSDGDRSDMPVSAMVKWKTEILEKKNLQPVYIWKIEFFASSL